MTLSNESFLKQVRDLGCMVRIDSDEDDDDDAADDDKLESIIHKFSGGKEVRYRLGVNDDRQILTDPSGQKVLAVVSSPKNLYVALDCLSKNLPLPALLALERNAYVLKIWLPKLVNTAYKDGYNFEQVESPVPTVLVRYRALAYTFTIQLTQNRLCIYGQDRSDSYHDDLFPRNFVEFRACFITLFRKVPSERRLPGKAQPNSGKNVPQKVPKKPSKVKPRDIHDGDGGDADVDEVPKKAKLKSSVSVVPETEVWCPRTPEGDVLKPAQLEVYLDLVVRPRTDCIPLQVAFAGELSASDLEVPETLKRTLIDWAEAPRLRPNIAKALDNYTRSVADSEDVLKISWNKAKLIAAILKGLDENA